MLFVVNLLIGWMPVGFQFMFITLLMLATVYAVFRFVLSIVSFIKEMFSL